MKEKWFQLPLSGYVQRVGFYAFLIHSSTLSEVVFRTTSAYLSPCTRVYVRGLNPSGIVVEIVGTEMGCQGRLCEEHDICCEVLKEDIVVRLRKIQLMVEGKEDTAIAAIWVTDGIDRCRVGFVPLCHQVLRFLKKQHYTFCVVTHKAQNHRGSMRKKTLIG